jgi:NAD-dependent deacetylase
LSAKDIEELAAMVQRARRAVVFTGAGVSTECGIPDFRSKGGFWTKNTPIQFSDFVASAEVRIEAWTRFFQIYDIVHAACPGITHKSIAQLHARGHISHVITQNIDELHEQAGTPHSRVIRLHGTASHAKCLSCGARHEIAGVRAHMAANNSPPDCASCGGVVKSATISFGQSMPEQQMADARAATMNADLFIAAGSSLQVFPAAGFPVLATQCKTPLVIVNREETGLDALADLVIRADTAPAFGAVANLLSDSASQQPS